MEGGIFVEKENGNCDGPRIMEVFGGVPGERESESFDGLGIFQLLDKLEELVDNLVPG